MAKGQVDIGFKADISNLRAELGKIPGITDKEAKAMVVSLQRSYSQMTRDAKKAAAQQKDAFKGFKNSWTELNSKLELVGKAYNKLVLPVLNFGTAQADILDQIGDLSAKTQISALNIEALNLAFDQTGLGVENVDGLLSKFSLNLGKAATVGGKAAQAFKLLNIDTRDSSGIIRDTNDVFEEAIKKIGALKTPTEQAAAATRLFGAEGANLIVALGDVDNLDAYVNYAEKFGLDVGPNATSAAARWEAATKGLGMAFKTAGTTLFATFGPTAVKLIDFLAEVFIFDFKLITDFISKQIDHWKELFNGLTAAFSIVFNDLKNGVVDIGHLKTALELVPKRSFISTIGEDLKSSVVLAGEAAKAYSNLRKAQDSSNEKKGTSNLGSIAKNADGLKKFYEEADAALQKYLDTKYKEQDLLTDLEAQISDATNKQLGEEGKIQAALDEKIRKLQEVRDEYWYMPEVAEKTAQLEVIAQQGAAKEILEYRKKTITESTDSIKQSFEALLGTLDNFEQQAHEVFNKEVIDPIMKPISAVQGGLSGIASLIGGPFWGPLAAGLTDAFMNSRETIGQLKEQLMSIPEILNDLPDLIADFSIYAAKEFVPTLIRALPLFITKLLESVPGIITGLVNAVPLIIDALIEAIPEIVYALIDSIPDIIIALISAIPDVAIALINGIVDFWKKAVPEMVRVFWESLKDFFVPSELFDKNKKTTTQFGDTVREIFTLGKANTNTYNDTPGPVQAGPGGMTTRLGAGDYMVAARSPKNLLKQALSVQKEEKSQENISGAGYIQWSDGAFVYDSFTKRHIRKKGAIYKQLYGAA